MTIAGKGLKKSNKRKYLYKIGELNNKKNKNFHRNKKKKTNLIKKI